MECYTATDFIHDCHEADESIIPRFTALQNLDVPYFFIKISAEFIVYGLTPEGDMSELPIKNFNNTCPSFLEVDKVLRGDTLTRDAVFTCFHSLKLPVDIYNEMWDHIRRCGDSMNQKPKSGRKILPMRVHISIATEEEVEEEGAGGTEEEEDAVFRESMEEEEEEEEEEEDAVFRESMEEEDVRRKPAKKESVEALQKQVVVSMDQKACCVICMDMIEVGTEALVMPCSHIYHGDCLLKWLEITNVCPLCRYQLPSSDDDDHHHHDDEDSDDAGDDFCDEDSDDDAGDFCYEDSDDAADDDSYEDMVF